MIQTLFGSVEQEPNLLEKLKMGVQKTRSGLMTRLEDTFAGAKEIDADIIALSTLMTTTMDGMGEVVRQLNAEGIRERFKVIVGGGPISQGFADRIGADGYAVNAADAVRLARRLTAAEAVAA